MRFPFRAILGGLLAGAAFFFFPFLLRFVVFALVIGFIIRLVWGPGWRGRRGWGPYRSWNLSGRSLYYDRFEEEDENGIVPIDGGRYASRLSGKGHTQAYRVD